MSVGEVMTLISEGEKILQEPSFHLKPQNYRILYEIQESEWLVGYLRAIGHETEAERLKRILEEIKDNLGFIAKTGRGYVVVDSEEKKKIVEVYGILPSSWGE